MDDGAPWCSERGRVGRPARVGREHSTLDRPPRPRLLDARGGSVLVAGRNAAIVRRAGTEGAPESCALEGDR